MLARAIGCAKRGGVGVCLIASTIALSFVISNESKSDESIAMAVPGTLDVTGAGAARYEIPIKVPPGTGGMSPTLSLEYSSQSGSGQLGIGWTLSGLSSIERCPRTQAQDGAIGTVLYDANDRFCLLGQRLVAVNGAYGANGTEYRLEIEGFTRFISYGTAGNGPAWFEAKTKSGQTLQFGNTTDSRNLAQGKTSARTWAINRVTDTKGNYLIVSYTVDAPNGQIYPSRIDYTGNAGAGLQPYNSVQFAYETRADTPEMFQGGSLVKTLKRLSGIKAYAGAALVHDYRLTYEQSPATAVSRLTSVTLCGGSGTCLPGTSLTYSGTNYMAGGVMGYSIDTNPAGLNTQLNGFQPDIGDFNGDGRQDVLWDKTDAYNRTIGMRELWLSSGINSFQRIHNVNNLNGSWGTGTGTSTFKRFVADFNGDLKSDILWVRVGTTGATAGTTAAGFIVLWLSNGDGTFQASNANPATIAAGAVPIVADFNGDGRADVYWKVAGVPLWLNAGGANFQVVTASASWGNGVAVATDFEGDGRADFLTAWAYVNIHGIKMSDIDQLRSNGNGTFDQSSTSARCTYQCAAFVPADFNGDARNDIFWRGGDGRAMWMSTGARPVSGGNTGFKVHANLNGQDGQSSYYRHSIFDFNADGKTDIMFSQPGNTSRYLWFSKGDGGFTQVLNVAGRNGVKPGTADFAGDLNGDGKAEILWDDQDAYGRSKGTRELWWSDTVASDLLATIADGLGAVTTITYAPLTKGAPVYTKDTNATFPTVDLQGPMYVVSRVEVSDGIGGTNAAEYSYAGAKSDLSGRGFLGFRQRVKKDMQTNLVETTDFRQDFPFRWMVAAQRTRLGNQLLSEVVNTYNATNLGGTRHFVSLSQSVESKWDLDGTPLPSVTAAYQYDSFGNPTQITTTDSAGVVQTTANTYVNDQVNWYLGRLTAATVTRTVP
jgi:hypothetical protein